MTAKLPNSEKVTFGALHDYILDEDIFLISLFQKN